VEHRAVRTRHAADGGRGGRAEDLGAEEVKVFAVEGEGGLTPGASHETRNSAWGLGLSNLVFLLDWNDFGIDVNAVSSVVHGTPQDWFEPYGWRVVAPTRAASGAT
jgi:transketolase